MRSLRRGANGCGRAGIRQVGRSLGTAARGGEGCSIERGGNRPRSRVAPASAGGGTALGALAQTGRI
jgi:hypothetical protein